MAVQFLTLLVKSVHKNWNSREYHYFEDDVDSMPIITLEVMQDSLPDAIDEDYYNDIQDTPADSKETGIHFLTQKNEESEDKDEASDETLRVRNDLLEYVTGSDGSVTCKLCGKVLASRQHWYRHKYRAHVMGTGNPSPAPLFQCEQCLIYFKSRKGYIGHIASRHSETLQDASPVLTNAQAEALAKEKDCLTSAPDQIEVKKEPDPEMSIPKAILPNYQAPTVKQNTTKSDTSHKRGRCRDQTNNKDWEEKRSQEEKLVADIIARVRRECEAQGTGPTRRGYSRKSAMRT